ncbi:MAG: AMP-binding protein [Burkholderiales bacterium]|nr:AMP-binding protein [Burkholderiales bacterium]
MTIRIEYPPELAVRYRAAGWWTDELLGDWLERAARAAPERVAVRQGTRVLTYAGLRRHVRALACGLDRLGIGKGDVVAVQLPNLAEFAISYLAIASRGAVMQTVHMPYRGDEIRSLLKHSGAVAMICVAEAKDYAAAALALALRKELPDLAHVIAVGRAPAGAVAFADLTRVEDGNADPRPVQVAAADPFVLLYTSGTTAAPKGVPHPYHTYLANFRLAAAELGVEPGDVVLCAAPFTHLYGLSALSVTLCAGATALLLPAYTPGEFTELVVRERPTVVYAGPAHVANCLARGLFDGKDCSSVRFVVLSGAPVSRDLAHGLESKLGGGKVLQLWGMTELQAGAYGRLTDAAEARVGSAGRAAPGNELRVTRDDGSPAAPGEVGELEMCGASLFAGYLHNPAASAAAFTADGWFRTGDLASIDAAGYLRLAGRTKELINRGGVKFSPLDVENLLAAHPAVETCAIVPMPDPVLGERACCFVTLRDPAAFGFEEMQRWLARHGVSKVRWPERLEVIDAMPMTPTRKVMKGALMQELERRMRARHQQ